MSELDFATDRAFRRRFSQKAWNLARFLGTNQDSEEVMRSILAEDGLAYRYVDLKFKNPNHPFGRQLILAALSANAFALEYVPTDMITLDIAKKAINNRAASFKFVPKELKSPELAMYAAERGCPYEILDAKYQTHEIRLAVVKKNGLAIRQIPHEDQTIEVAEVAVDQDPWALQDVAPNLWTTSIREKALGSDGNTLVLFSFNEFKQTEGEALIAVRNNGEALYHVQKQAFTKDVILAAVQKTPQAIRLVPHSMQWEELALEAVKNKGSTLRLLPAGLRTPQVLQAALQNYGDALEYVKYSERTEELVTMAVKQNGISIRFAPFHLKYNFEVVMAAVTKTGDALYHLDLFKRSITTTTNLTEENVRAISWRAVRTNGRAILHCPEHLRRNPKLVRTALNQDGTALQHCKKNFRQNADIVMHALRQNTEAFRWASYDCQKQIRSLVWYAHASKTQRGALTTTVILGTLGFMDLAFAAVCVKVYENDIERDITRLGEN